MRPCRLFLPKDKDLMKEFVANLKFVSQGIGRDLFMFKIVHVKRNNIINFVFEVRRVSCYIVVRLTTCFLTNSYAVQELLHEHL